MQHESTMLLHLRILVFCEVGSGLCMICASTTRCCWNFGQQRSITCTHTDVVHAWWWCTALVLHCMMITLQGAEIMNSESEGIAAKQSCTTLWLLRSVHNSSGWDVLLRKSPSSQKSLELETSVHYNTLSVRCWSAADVVTQLPPSQ